MRDKKILIIEDEEEVASALKSFLEEEGFSGVEHAVDGIQAVRKARSFLPDLILLDIKMPGWDGVEVIKKLRLSVPTRQIPVIVTTGMYDETVKKKLLAEGVSTYFQKPYNPEALIEEIERVFGKGTSS